MSSKRLKAETLAKEAKDKSYLVRIHDLQLKNNSLKSEKKELIKQLKAADARADLLEVLEENPKPKPVRKRSRSKKTREATAVLLCSDWHVGEAVDPKKVNGLNKYNPDIARERVGRLLEGFIWNLDMVRSQYTIKDIIIWFGGDMITGWLHRDGIQTNHLTPIEEILLAQDLAEGLIDGIRSGVDFERLMITCSYGNHARLTERTVHNAVAESSLEFIMYHSLKRRYEKHTPDDRLEFHIAAGKLLYVPVYNRVIRFSHGDDISFGGGVGGITIPINKAVNGWNTARHADIDCMGHWHQYVNLPYLSVNNCLIGYSPYSIKLRAPYSPPSQSFFIVDADHGKRYETPIWVEGK